MENDLTRFEECPNCGEGDERRVYRCEKCGFIGCYDEVFENGCFQGREEIEQCPKCGSRGRTLVGQVGPAW